MQTCKRRLGEVEVVIGMGGCKCVRGRGACVLYIGKRRKKEMNKTTKVRAYMMRDVQEDNCFLFLSGL